MKTLLQQFIYLDERTGKFSTSKFMMLVCFYSILFLVGRALFLDREIKNVLVLQETFLVTSTLYFGRRFNFKSKNLDIGSSNDSTEKDN